MYIDSKIEENHKKFCYMPKYKNATEMQEMICVIYGKGIAKVVWKNRIKMHNMTEPIMG